MGKEITDEEFNSQPEIYMDVDVQSRRLVPVSREEAESRGAARPSREESERPDTEFRGQVSEAQSQFFKALRMYTFVSSWHVAEHESAAMWSLYGKEGASIAIQSTVERLRRALPEKMDNHGQRLEGHIDVALVQYTDYQAAARIPEGYMFDAFLYKRKSFEHERELRAVFQAMPIPDAGHGQLVAIPSSERGRQVPVDLDQLIAAIYVSPTSPALVYELVKKGCARYRLRKPISLVSLRR